ncbi:protein lingerer-like isoform X3 [Physella acuta]|uniref:protein lingerer-like isoform X3 n=1 Tax=Physella acuta TaxID=109671 RepID=UPI0027DE2A83|nr:protein lingerer-like isoform X3 [Physella acuta]
MSGSVGTMRAGSNRHSGTKEKIQKSDRTPHQPQQTTGKTDIQSNKMQPTQDQILIAQIMGNNQTKADPKTEKLVKELMEMTGKSEDVVVIALHDSGNDAERAANMLLEGDEQQGEWREQGGKRKKKVPTTQKENVNHVNEDSFESRNKDKGEKEEKDQDGALERYDAPPRKGRRNGGPPPRLARGWGRDRGNFGDRENRDNRERNTTEDWDNDRGDERRERSGSDRGRSRGRGFGGKRSGGGGRGRFNNSGDRDTRNFTRVPRFEKINNSQPMEGPEIDTWTNETAENNTNWDNWNDTWVTEEDQWTGTLEETKVFTPSQMKIPDPDPVITEPPSSLGQRLDVGSLFIESAKFSKAPDYSKPSGDAYITQFNQAATESIKNTIGIGSSTRPPQSTPNSLGLSSLTQSSSHVQGGVLSNLNQPGQQSSLSQSITQLSQITQSSQVMSQISMGSQQSNRDQSQTAQSRITSVMQQQQNMSIPSMNNNLQQRPKPQRSKLPPPSKIPASAVEMPGHIPRNPQLDLQFGIDFSSDSGTSFGFGSGSDEVEPASTYTNNSNGTSVISNHLGQGHVSTEGNAMVTGIKSSPSSGSNKVLSSMEPQQSNRQSAVFHNSVYTASPPKNENQNLDRESNKITGSDIPFSSTQLERSLPQAKSEGSSNYPTANGYASTYQNHQKASSISQTQSYTHTTNSQPPQGSSFPSQYSASQTSYQSSGQNQFSAPPSATQFPPSGQPPQFNNAQSQYSTGQNQFASAGNTGHITGPHANHPSQYSSGAQNSYTSSGQSQYSGYQNNSSFPSHTTQPNYPSTNQASGANASLYPVATQSSGSYTSQSNSYQSPSAGSYHARDSQQSVPVTTQTTGVNFPASSQSSTLKPANSQTNTNYNSQSFAAAPAPLQPSPLANKLGESLSKMTLKDTTTLEAHQSAQYENSSASTTSVSTTLSMPSSTSSASLSTGTTTISSTSTATSITPTSRITSMPSTSKAPPNLPPGVPLPYIMGQSTMPPFYSVQPPLYGYETDMLLQQRMPLQTGSYYDLGAIPAPAGSTLPTGRDQQPTLTSVPFAGSSADSNKMTRVDAQSPNSTSQPQNAHSAAQQPVNYFHYGYYYPSVFPGAAGLQYPVFPIPPVTNAAAHAGSTATTQFQKTYSHVYTTKGYEELNQAQDFSKTGYGSSSSTGNTSGTRMSTRTKSSEIAPNAYNKTHSQAFDKQAYHGGTPPPFNLPLATATQAGPMGAPTTPYGTPFLPVMAHSQMMHHPIQQESNNTTSRGHNQAGSQSKTGGSKNYGAPQYWNN